MSSRESLVNSLCCPTVSGNLSVTSCLMCARRWAQLSRLQDPFCEDTTRYQISIVVLQPPYTTPHRPHQPFQDRCDLGVTGPAQRPYGRRRLRHRYSTRSLGGSRHLAACQARAYHFLVRAQHALTLDRARKRTDGRCTLPTGDKHSQRGT